ncbi:3-hydroxyacyl-CoA dehydrogenase family protein [Jeotgalicoccus sp. FSL K6-3177]|uniref:3-hydroxyacyl-CoA dehydrogenase family protein n=1 Tax=Jeotgalicoccus sp. FSL K6-3177 TaxID=2921494 RepID=UPI0030FD9BB0
MERVSVIGSGTMGHSIAISLAWHHHPVKVYCIDEEAVKNAKENIKAKLGVMMNNKVINDPQANSIESMIELKTSFKETISEATFIIEAITENLEIKKELYNKVSKSMSRKAVLASNTSGFLPSELSAGFKYPEQFVVTHFWNPAHLIPLVEIVPSGETREETIKRTEELLKKINKKPIVMKKEIIGFIGNRLQYAMLREAQYLLDNGYADKEDIDVSVTHSIGRRYPVTGPLMTADLGGLDVFSAISNYLFKELSKADSSGETIMNLVEQGQYGSKNGRGFYEWGEEASREINSRREKMLIEFLKIDETEV